MKKIVKFQSITSDRNFEFTLMGQDITPLNVSDSIDVPSGMSKTGFVRFIVQSKNVFLDTSKPEWEEIITLTGQFIVISREK